MRQLSEQEIVRREKAKELESMGIDPFGHRVDVTSDSKSIKEEFAEKTTEELEEINKEVVIAGRIMTKRGKGKAGFINIQDKYGQIQVYVKIDNIGEDAYEIFKKSDLGDIVCVTGTVMRTHMGDDRQPVYWQCCRRSAPHTEIHRLPQARPENRSCSRQNVPRVCPAQESAPLCRKAAGS